MTESAEIAFWNGHHNNAQRYAVSIDWCKTDAEIIADLSELIPKLRPPWRVEPKMAGRTGRKLGTGAVDMLNQLGAFRSQRAGLSFSEARHVTIYTTERGWRKAAITADERIRSMMIRPLFES